MTLLVGGGQTPQGVLAFSTGVDACYKECSDNKIICESPCSANKTTEPTTCLTECKYSLKGCMQVCDEDFPDSNATNAKVSLEPDYAPRQYLARLGSRGSSGLTVSGTSVERFEPSSGSKLDLGFGSKESVPEDEEVGQIQGTLTVVVKHDNYPYEIAWILNKESWIIAYQNQASITTPRVVVSQSFTVTAGEFVFTIYDAGKDGICCESGEGYWAFYLDGYLFSYSYFLDGGAEQVSFSLI
jgi:hypothetical protein